MNKSVKIDPYASQRLHATNNEIEIVKSKKCGCYFCQSTFSARRVKDWLSDSRGVSALCPECGMDTVLGDASGLEINERLLQEMGEHYFSEQVSLQAAKAYVARYEEGRIGKTAHSDRLYAGYLERLSRAGDGKATLSLARLYLWGSPGTEKDGVKAQSYLRSPLLLVDAEALADLTWLYAYGKLGLDKQEQARRALETAAKACALGSLKAAYLLSAFYMEGHNVEKDPVLAYRLLDENFGDVYARFVYDHKGGEDFIFYNYALARDYEHGLGTERYPMLSARHYLLALFALLNPLPGDYVCPQALSLQGQVEAGLKRVISELSLSQGSPIYDQDTYFDSFADNGGDDAPKTLRVLSYNKEEGKLSFEVGYPSAPLIVDIAMLYCGYVAGNIRWDFSHIASAKFAQGDLRFERVDNPSDEFWEFVHVDEQGQESVVMSLQFYSDPAELKELKIAQSSAGAKKEGK